MIYFKMFAPFFTFAVAIIYVAFQEKWWKIHDGRRVRHKRAVCILVFFLLLSTIATCVIIYRDARDSQDLQCQVKKLGIQVRGLARQNAELLTKIENCQPPQRIGALKPRYSHSTTDAMGGVSLRIRGQIVEISAPEGTVFQPFGRNIAFSLRRTADGLLISAVSYNLDGRVIARVIDNEWVAYDGRYLRRNFNEHAIEMVDDYDVPVLQVEYVTPTSARIGGVFRAESDIIANIDKQFPAMPDEKGGTLFCTVQGGARIILGDQTNVIGGKWPTTDAERQSLAIKAKRLITLWFDYSQPRQLGVHSQYRANQLKEYDKRVSELVSGRAKYSAMTSSELRNETLRFVAKLRESMVRWKLESNRKTQEFFMSSGNDKGKIDEWLTVTTKALDEYSGCYSTKALLLRNELLSRLPPNAKDQAAGSRYDPATLFCVESVANDLARMADLLK